MPIKLQAEIERLQQEKIRIATLLELQKKIVYRKFEHEPELEKRFWQQRDEQLLTMIIRVTFPACIIFFIFTCISLGINYFSAESAHLLHDMRRNVISFAAAWLSILVIFVMARLVHYRKFFKYIVSGAVCFGLTVNLSMQMGMLSLPILWRGTLVFALGMIFIYLSAGLRPKFTFFLGMLVSALTFIYILWMEINLPWSIVLNTLLLPNLVGLALAILALSTDRIGFLMAIIIEYDKQIYALLNQHFEHLSHHDSLTSLANRRGFETNLSQAMSSTQNTGQACALLFIDVDFFKKYNDFYGHDQGDQVLIAVANTLQRYITEEDIAIRFGGEEFVLLLKNSSPAHASQVAQSILEDINMQKIEHQHSPIAQHLTLSIGLSVYTGQVAMSDQQLLKMADDALYQAKFSGRNGYQMYESP